jgi:hypothetical protein
LLNALIKAFFITLILCPLSLFARDITVTVVDSSLELPLDGAVIRTRDGKEYICDEEGKAVVQVPDNRQTIIYAAYPGYETGAQNIPLTGNSFTIGLNLSGYLQGRELVVEASRPGSSETSTGRSVAVSSGEIAQTAEIGIFEDVMSTIKLLPGVNYSGAFNTQPSIRGGYPGDMGASLDGFFISNPYHWRGGYSIFDPHMVQNAQLSTGVFSARYGHSISGLLEVTAKKPSSEETMFELGINTSMANLNLSIPLSGRGGILFMGRITYYDPLVTIAKDLSKTFPKLDVIKYAKRAPYIRAASADGNYSFADNLELTATGFFGMDGVSVEYETNSVQVEIDLTNFQGFLTSSLLWTPRADMLFKFTAGTGYEDYIYDGIIEDNAPGRGFTGYFQSKYPDLLAFIGSPTFDYLDRKLIKQSDSSFNIQGRVDYDWEITERFLLAAGVQEMYNLYGSHGEQSTFYDTKFTDLEESQQTELMSHFPSLASSSMWEDLRISVPIKYSPNSQNNLFTTSAYILAEYNNGGRLKAELGLRFDHFFLYNKGFSLSGDPALNPRLNIDFNVLKNFGFLESLDLSGGTGLFSSIDDNIFAAEKKYNIKKIKPNRSWTSVLGIKFQFSESLSLNIEGYYKYIFNRMYAPVPLDLHDMDINPRFDGEGIVWGADIMLHKAQSRFWDGWLSYSFNWAKYHDPEGKINAMGISGGNFGSDWYFPSYHRFHNLNLVLNIKPIQNINIYIRFGLASGMPSSRRAGNNPITYPVLMYENNPPNYGHFIEKRYWPSSNFTFSSDASNRTTMAFPLDIKFSIFGGKKNGKTRYEMYFAVENIFALEYTTDENNRFNDTTIDKNSNFANFEMPIPIPSFGFKISY